MRGVIVAGLAVLALAGAVVQTQNPRPPGVRPVRVQPLEPKDWTDADKEALGTLDRGAETANFIKVLLRHRDLWLGRRASGSYIGRTLSPRVRELLILRTLWRCGADYDWVAHSQNFRRAGGTEDELRRLATEGAAGWSPADAALVRATDDLHASFTISDATWAALSAHSTEKQIMDVVFLVGQYTQGAMAMNAFGVPLDPGHERGFPSK